MYSYICVYIYINVYIFHVTFIIQIKSPIFKIHISSRLSQFSFSLQHILQIFKYSRYYIYHLYKYSNILNIQKSNYQPLFTVFLLQHLANKLPFEIYFFSILIANALSTFEPSVTLLCVVIAIYV